MKDSGLMLQMVHTAMKSAGVDVSALYRQLGFDAEQLDLRALRSPHERQALFWEALEKLTGDAEIGLSLCPHLPPFRGEVLEYLMYTSSTFGEGCARTLKYLRLVSDALRVQLVSRAGLARIEFADAGPKLAAMRHTEICVGYSLILFLSHGSEGQFKPSSVSLACASRAPKARFEAVFGCPVRLDQAASFIEFDPALLNLPSPRYDADLLRLHEEFAQKRLVKIERQDLIERIRALFSQRLESGQCDLDGIASALDISPRRLRFELAQAQTSFSEVLDTFRFALAKKLLGRTAEPLEHIVYLTGFSEPSTFYRAFKRWAGVTPVQFRDSRRNAVPASGIGKTP